MYRLKTTANFNVGGGTTSNYEFLENKPKINGVELTGNKSLNDLGIDQDFVKDNNYTHTDNNYTNEDKNKLNNLENYDDTDIKEDIKTLHGKQDKLVSGTNIKTINGNSLLGEGDIQISGSDISGLEHDIENLTELIKEDQDNIKELQKGEIASFNTSKPSADGLLTINAVTKNNQNIQAFNIYNGLDAKYPYSAFGSQSAKELNDRVKALESGGGSSSGFKTYYNKSGGGYDIDLRDDPAPGIYLNYQDGFYIFLKGMNGSNANVNVGFGYFVISKKYSETENNEVFAFYRTYDGKGHALVKWESAEGYAEYVNDGYWTNKNDVLTKTNTTAYTPTLDYHPSTKKYCDDLFKTYTGYDEGKTQVLKNINGTLTWVNE